MKLFRRVFAAMCAALCLTTVVSPKSTAFITVNAIEKNKEVVLSNTKVPTPTNSGYIETYTTSTSGRVNSFDSAGWIDAAADRCRIVGYNSDGSLRISFPTSHGRITRNFKTNCFTTADLKNASFDMYKVTKNFQCYRRRDKKNAFGSAYKNDLIYHVATSGNMIQIIYPLTGTNNYRMCWTPKSNMNYMEKQISKVDLVNMYLSTNNDYSSAEFAISEFSYASKVVSDTFFTTEFLSKVCNLLGSTVTSLGNPVLMAKSVLNVSSCSTTFTGFIMVMNVENTLKKAIEQAKKVLSWKNKEITNSNWRNCLEDIRDMYVYNAYARGTTSDWLNDFASLNTPRKRVEYLINLCATGIGEGVLGVLGEAEIDKKVTAIVNAVDAATTGLQCLINTAPLFGGESYQLMKSAQETFDKMIATVNKLP